MIERISSKFSAIAFAVALFLFVAANGISYFRMQFLLQTFHDGYAECGFPFRFYGHGGFAPISQFLWEGLVADYCIAFLASVFVGVMWKKFKA